MEFTKILSYIIEIRTPFNGGQFLEHEMIWVSVSSLRQDRQRERELARGRASCVAACYLDKRDFLCGNQS